MQYMLMIYENDAERVIAHPIQPTGFVLPRTRAPVLSGVRQRRWARAR